MNKINGMKKRIIFLVMILLFLIVPTTVISANVDSQVFEKLNENQEVSVIVMLKEGNVASRKLSDLGKPEKVNALEQKKAMIKEQQDKVLSKLNLKSNGSKSIYALTSSSNIEFSLRHKYSTVNGFSGMVTKAGLEKLRNNPDVKKVYLNSVKHILLDDSVPQINGDDTWNLKLNNINITGKDETICVIDTGIDTNHSAFSGRILDQYCYCNITNYGSEGCCPNNKTEDNSAEDDNGHGTHCAGIVAGNHSIYKGVAPEAGIILIKVCNSTGTCSDDDIIAGINWCINNATLYNISVISMSLGDKSEHNTYCNDDVFAPAINSAAGQNISVIVASGNDNSTNGISSPACVQNATPVGAVYDANGSAITWSVCTDSARVVDNITCFTNRGNILDLLAPGALITAPYIGGGIRELGGTSMSTPHVAGAAALLKQFVRLQNETDIIPQKIEDVLNDTGMQVYDDETERYYSRIDVYAAILSLDAIPPNIRFVNITPENETVTSNTSIIVNVTVNDSLNNISSCLLEWNNTNESMTKIGNGTSIYCYKNKSIVGTGIFYYKAYANDSVSNIGVSELRQINITNTAPDATNVTINSTDYLNRTNGTLIGSWCFYDANSDSQWDNETKWYNNSIEVTTLSNLTVIGSGNTTKNQNWTFSIRVFDGTEWSEWANSSVLAIENSAPTQPSLTNPENESTQTSVNVTINWTAGTDADNDTINYFIHFLNSLPPTYNSSTQDLYKTFTDLTDNETYYWYIIANDGTENSTDSEKRQFTIDTSIQSLNFVNSTPTDGERLTDNYICVNATVTHSSLNISNCTLLWNSTHNYSMTKVGTGTSVSCFKNMTTLDGINYTYSVIANTTDGVEGTTGNRTNLENTKPQLNISYPDNNSNIPETSTYLNWSGNDAEDSLIYYVYGNSTRNLTLELLYNSSNKYYSWDVDDGTYYWYVVANDSYETNTSSEYKFNVNVPPTLSGLSLSSASGYSDTNITIYANCSDTGSNVSSLIVSVYYPNSTWINYSMTPLNETSRYTKSYRPNITGTYNFSFYCEDYYGNIASNESTGLQFTSSTKPSSPSGGGGGGTLTVTYEQKSIGTLAAGSSKKVTFLESNTHGITEIEVKIKNRITNAKIRIDAGSLPSGTYSPSTRGSVYKYIEITKIDIADDDIEKAVIQFKVKKSWLTDKIYGRDAVTLHRYNNKKWENLETTRTDFGAEYYYYSAESPGFSTFSITAEKAPVVTQPAEEQEEAPEEEAEENVTIEEPQVKKEETTPIEEPKKETKSNIFLIVVLIAMIIILAVVGYFVQKKKQKKKRKYKKKKKKKRKTKR